MEEEIIKQEFVEIKEEPVDDAPPLVDEEFEFEFTVTEDDYWKIVKELRGKDDDLIELEATLVKCPEEGCTKIFKSNKYLYRHKKKKHRKEEDTKETENSTEFAICHLCGLDVKGSLKMHLRNHEKKEKKISQDETDGETTICHLCGLDVKGNFKLHIKNHEKLEKQKEARNMHRCEICGKTFIRAVYLRKHYIVHTEEKPYECKWCGKKLRQESNLRYHMKRHVGVKEFVCDLCGRECSSKEQLEKHSRTHGTNNAFQCNICLRSYRHQSTLSRHSKMHTHIMKCHLCYQTFRYDSHLRKHLLEFHKDVDGINQPRPVPVTVKLKKSSTKVEMDETAEAAVFYQPSSVIVNNVNMNYKHPSYPN